MLKNRVVWDLDGVLRDLCQVVFGYTAPEWWHLKDGKNLFEIIAANEDLLEQAPGTEYLQWVINNLEYIFLISVQLKSWIPRTEKWIDNNIVQNGVFCGKYYASNPPAKDEFCKVNNLWIVEDHPQYPDYSKVLLIDRPYNSHVKAPYRVHCVKELEHFINAINKGDI